MVIKVHRKGLPVKLLTAFAHKLFYVADILYERTTYVWRRDVFAEIYPGSDLRFLLGYARGSTGDAGRQAPETI